MPIPKKDVHDGVAEKVKWWVGKRREKLVSLQHKSHAVNPFLWPIIQSMHGFKTFRELVSFQLAGHLVEGHATGFGKLVDEKILSDVFGTTKLDAKYRRENGNYKRHAYDNVDHLIRRPDGSVDLLSLKAGRWSIQLGQAVQLNRSFQVLLNARREGQEDFAEIVIGVFYGTQETLTDKYTIIRGLPTRASHDVVDISADVQVLAGREFWSWINDSEADTQEWVLEGIGSGYDLAVQEHGPLDVLFEEFIDDFSASFDKYADTSGKFDWMSLLKDING